MCSSQTSPGAVCITVVTGFTSELSLVSLSACRKSLVTVLVNVNIAHVRSQRDQIPFFFTTNNYVACQSVVLTIKLIDSYLCLL